ncbi:unnamed protein product, partial [Trichobilharzia regenti]
SNLLSVSTKRQDSEDHNGQVNTSSSSTSSDQLPLSIDLENTNESTAFDTLMDQFIHLLDRILQCAQSDLITGHRSSSQKDMNS